MLKLTIAAAALISVAYADCPNACSGHGDCGTQDQCQCYDGFYGGDCSLRVCPTGTAFVDLPRGDLNHDGRLGYSAAVGNGAAYSKVQWSRYQQYETWPTTATVDGSAPAAIDGLPVRDIDSSASNMLGGWSAQVGEAHFQIECSGKGSCDRQLGVCKCFDGYTGAACQRTTCPNDCSGHGVCRTVGEIASRAYDKTFVESIAGSNTYDGILSPFEYRLWDANQNSACVCDVGYSGIDCSLRQCPRGDDPLTTSKSTCGGNCVSEVQSFSVDGGQGNAVKLPGTYYLVFTDYSGLSYKTKEFKLFTDASVANWATTHKLENEAAVKNALEALPNAVTGIVSVSSGSAYGTGGNTAKSQYRLSVTFTSKSGNVPEMSIGWSGTSNPSTLRAFVFQPSQPVKVFTIDATATKVWFKVYPTDQTLFGLPTYWVSRSAAISMDFSLVGSAADAVVAALNSIPAVRLAYGQPFVRDNNVVATGSNGGTYTISVAFPDKLFGLNKVEFSTADPAVPSTVMSRMTDLSDVIDGNKEASICSNRGICDYASGICKCFTGHTGVGCEVQSALAL